MIELSIIFLFVGASCTAGYLPIAHRSPSWGRTAIKTVPLLSLAFFAFSAQTHPFLTMGLLLSAFGDMALSRPGTKAFLYGLVSFALAHILYALLFTSLSDQPLWAAFSNAPLFAIIMLTLAFSTELWLTPHVGNLRWPVRIYIALIGLMMLAALNLPPEYALAALGAGAFVASDLILSVQRFRMTEVAKWYRATGWAVWVLYITGQTLILVGVAVI